MIRIFFAIAACLTVCWGCAPQAAPDYDRLQSQLLCDVCDALAEGDLDRSGVLLVRYLDTDSGSRFARLALAHEKERELTDALNSALAAGDVDAVREVFDRARDDGQAYKTLIDYGGLPGALDALQLYLRSRPFGSAEEMAKAMSRLESFLALLKRSAAFARFWSEDLRILGDWRSREQALSVQYLVHALDEAAVSRELPVSVLLADLGAMVPEHPVFRASRCVKAGDWTAFRDMALESLERDTGFAPLEIACCLHWPDLSPRERRIVGRLFSRGEPETLSGLVLHAWQSAMEGRSAEAVQRARRLVCLVPPSQDLIAAFLCECVISSVQFNAWCWRSPAPGVIDVFGRIQQLRAHNPIQ